MPKVSEAHLERRRRQIMAAALACFSRQGFHRTTMQDIVKESGLSAGAFYTYFPSKEAIVAALADEHHRSEAETLARVDTASDAVMALATLVHASLGRLDNAEERQWRRVTVQLWAEALRDPHIMDVVRSGLDGPLEVLADVIARGQREGTLPSNLDPKATARVCVAIFQGLVVQQAWEPALDVSAYIEAVLGILAGLASAARDESVTTG
ncbi:MAG TPA: TetR/AcrR family transcriptional regulator [Acidimicrobiales bacterium]|nr:TetR/AcrR family transcriptional regulator [Acidimicrobiales bacterium]